MPGKDGIGTIGITPTATGYDRAADQLVHLYNEGCHIDTNDHEVQRVMEYFDAKSMDDLRTKMRGW